MSPYRNRQIFGLKVIFLSFLALWMITPDILSATDASVRPVDLRCEYLSNPLGIDVVKPRLSWRLEAVNPDNRGQRQAAYHILVRDPDKEETLWDSGWIKSDHCTNVEYEGKALTSRMRCTWKVRVQDEQGTESAWSEPAHWTMGLLNPNDWKAKWIGSDQVFERKQGWPPPDNDVPDPWLRKTFTLADKPARACIYVASVGYHDLYVNGKKVGDAVLSPSVATHKKRARYVTYDISDHLQKGKNVIGLWLGVSWSIFPHYKTEDRPQTPMVIAQAEMILPDGKRVQIDTDETWKTHPSPNTLLGVWDFMHYGGERWDANKEMPDWCAVDLDDTQWKEATKYLPKLPLSAEMIEPNRRIKKVTPVGIKKLDSGAFRVDLGVVTTGFLETDVSGNPGDVIEFKFSERHDQEMTHRHRSQYVVGPEGEGTFANRFNYFTGRWITIEGLQQAPKPEDIRVWLVRTDYDRVGRFECSNELLNRIYDTTLWTCENLSLGGYVVDCPQRERMGYGGDAHATTETGMTNYELAAFYTKWSQDWRDVQEENGNLPYTAPTYWGGGGPGWSGYCITLPWEMYRHYGDKRILEVNFTTMQKWLAFMETKTVDNMLVRWGGQWDFLGDWLWPGAEGVNGDTIETLFFNNCYWIYNLQTAAKAADVLGKQTIAEQYRKRAEQVRKAVHSKFFNPADNSYVNGFQGYLAIALLVDLPPESLRPAVWKRLEEEILIRRRGHIHAGITAGAMLFKTLLAADRGDLIFPMVNTETYPGWGDMLKHGATTLWEDWEGRSAHSLCHSSYLYIGTWFIESLGGINLDPRAAGYQHFVIKPNLIEDPSLTWVRSGYNSHYGPIECNWRMRDGRVQMRIVVPPNTTAKFYPPAGQYRSISESGKGVRQAEGVSLGKESDGSIWLGLQPGRYRFAIRNPVFKPVGTPKVTLAEAGQAKAAVVLADDATEPEKHAANELANFLKQVTGGDFSVVAKPTEDKANIFVGTSAARLADPTFDTKSLGDEGIAIVTRDNNLILTGHTPRGTLYAVYSFLEDIVGSRWWSSKASTIPNEPTLRVGELNIRYTPALEYRESFWSDAFDGDWAVRNHCNGQAHRLDAKRGDRHKYEGFVHTFYSLIPPATYFEKHPEWFSEINGKRVHERAQLCLTNDEMKDELIKNLKARLRANPAATIASVSQNDWHGYCTCAKCKAIDEANGSPSGTMLTFVNSVADAIRDGFPHVAISTLAYQYTRKPPTQVKPRDNVIVRLCSIECSFSKPLSDKRNEKFREDIVGWSKICDRLYIWDYTTNFRHYFLPHPNLRVLGPNIRFFVDNGVKGIFEQGAYTSLGAEMAELRAWMLAKLLWNPNADDRQLMDEFLTGYYGPAGVYVERYLNLIHDAVEQSGDHLGCFSQDTAKFLTFETMSRGWRVLKEAEAAVAGDTELLNRVKVAQLPVMYAFMRNWRAFHKAAEE
ncbi:MAG: family 78 glycoside hydrolase catalytic domain, partial [Sedimentisphaerales bacterium]|nr:family 78 glycoside hydrolase catalytic domain [Sedimentisphaerales bacterium]